MNVARMALVTSGLCAVFVAACDFSSSEKITPKAGSQTTRKPSPENVVFFVPGMNTGLKIL
jgi:hypothetical protein